MDRRRCLLHLLSLVPAAVLAGCASPGGQPAASAASGLKFGDAERKIIEDYYARQRAGVMLGAKPAQRAKPGDKLDTGQRPAKLPTELDKLLPTLAKPHTRLTLGADVILVNRDTLDILDVIPQVAY
ncbi:MAG: hypothetical protein MUC79_10705 [Thiobacillaceae bacterium]|jgi:hypothetical protein|nr:hypothetical protein [Thiobacillaceae bacterium]